MATFTASLGRKAAGVTLAVGFVLGAAFVWTPATASFSAAQVIFVLYILLFILVGIFVWDVVLPLKRVTREMDALLTGREYTHIVHARNDEIAVLAQFFNAVIQGIGSASGELQDAKRVSAELVHAATVQKRLLPTSQPVVPGLDVLVKTKSASEVGGDNFDIIPKEGSTLFALGDATGHGFPAGLIMSMVNVLLHAAAEKTENTQEILALVNRCLTPKILPTMFMTLVMLRWEHETQKLFYTGCGHEHILVYRAATGEVEAIRTGGIALGMVPKIEKILKEKEIALSPQDAVVLFTDGITEARNGQGTMYGVEGLMAALREHGGLRTARAIFTGISKDFDTFVGSPFTQEDDITLMVLKYNFSGIGGVTRPTLTVDTSGIQEAEKASFEWGA